MYRVNEQTFQSFTAAVAVANAIRGEVFDVETGARRWYPAPKVSQARLRRYEQQKAAYDVQQAHNAKK